MAGALGRLARRWWRSFRDGLARDELEDRLGGVGAADRSVRERLANLWPFVRRHWRMGVLGAALLLFGSLVVLPQPLVSRFLIDEVLLGKRLELLAVVLAVLAGLKLFGMASSVVQSYAFTRFEQTVLLDIQEALLERTLHLPKAFFDDKEVGYLMSRLGSDVQGVRVFFSSYMVQIASSLIRFVGGVALLLWLEWRLALVVVLVLPLLFLGVGFFTQRLRIISHHGMERRAVANRRMQESLASAALIKAFGSEEREVSRVMTELRGAFGIALERVAVSSVAGVTLSGLGDVARLVVVAVGGWMVIADHWTLGSLFAFQAYVGHVFGPAQFLAHANLQLQSALAALERVSALFEIVPEENVGTGDEVDRLEGTIELRDVSFAYDGRDPVLDGVSFSVAAGERVAIVGPSGVGKTTLISLILRFYRPTSGEVLFDGRPASELEVTSLRRRLGYVSQSTLLMSGTVRENLLYGNPEAGEEEMIAAARVAEIHDFVAGLAQGYDTRVGERGVNFSEGQKQRLAIARALIRDPDIVVLDEPSSALDAATEQSVLDHLPEAVQNKTVLVVAHRPSTIQAADRVLVLKDRQVVEAGSPAEVVSQLSG
jgi:ABC-type multidrug transport system fused ATPase/permease subunit